MQKSMFVLITCFLASACAGSGSSSGTSGSNSSESPSLTAEQRAAWERARAKSEKGAFYIFALVGVNSPEWRGVDAERIHSGSGWEVDCNTTRSRVGLPHFKEERTYISGTKPFVRMAASEAANEIVKVPSTQFAVVADLFSKKDPVVVSWHRSEGKDVKQIKAPPSAIQQSLAKHLLIIQQKIGD